MMSSGSNSEKLSSSFKNVTSGHSEGKEAPRVPVHDENANSVPEGEGDASLVADSVCSDKYKVSDVTNEIKYEDQSSKTVGLFPTGVSFKKEHPDKVDVSNADYESMLSMFDEYAANGKTLKVGHGYEVGDMVWGKVKSHPWWPGHIFSEAFATTSVRKAKREGHVLVAFFGDSSYGWFDPAELIPFELNYAEKSRQTCSRTFVKAVEDAVDELNRRHSLGLTCRCRNPYSFRPTNVEGYLAVDFGDSEGVFSVSQIRRARDSFVPAGMLGFLKDLALKPMNNEPWDIEFIQNNANVLAFRKAVYEKFDETYAQAFGTQPARLTPAKTSLKPSRAPLSGRLVFAEALGKRTGKPSKSKVELEKDKYVFKRRDDPSFTSSHPSQTDGSDLPSKGPNPDVLNADQFHSNELVNDNLSEKHKKAKVRKRPLGNTDSTNSNTKKRKKDLVMETTHVVEEDGQVNLSQLLHDLRALALNPFHGSQINCSAKVSHVFMNFRSLVYLKSPSNESKEARLSKLASISGSSDNNVTRPSQKTTTNNNKPAVSGLLEDSTKGGLKRGPSDHLELVAAKKKRIEDVKLLAAKKRASSEATTNKVERKDNNDNNNNSKEVVVRKPVAASTLTKGILGSEPAKKREMQGGSPTMVVMKFPLEASLPSSAELRAKFGRFGSMDYNATRIFYSSHTCRVVYNRKSDAQAALNFATSIFGNMNVRCFLRENPDSESSKIQVDDSHDIGTSQQLKSCLRRTSNEVGTSTGNGKGRVKFILGGEGGINRTNDDDDDIASSQELVSNTRDKFHVSSSTNTILVTSPQFPFAPNSFPHTIEDIQPRNYIDVARAPTSIDIRQTMLSLLCRCEVILKTLEGSFGYVPYHL